MTIHGAIALRGAGIGRNGTPTYVVTCPTLESTLTGDQGHSADVMSVALSADGRRVVSGSDDKTIKAWDLATGQCEATPGGEQGHSSWVMSVALSADGRRVVRDRKSVV